MQGIVKSTINTVFNQSLNEGVVPDSWKTAYVEPIFKKGDKSMASKYCSISLTSLVGKLLESIIAKKNQTSFRNIYPNKYISAWIHPR